MIQGAVSHGNSSPMHYYEGGYEPEWIAYLLGENPQWPEEALDISIAKVQSQIAGLEREAEDGPEKLRKIATAEPWHTGYCGPLVNLMTGGLVPQWDGQLHLGRFRYFDPARRRPGIPPDCAALVESLEDDGAPLQVCTDAGAEHMDLPARQASFALDWATALAREEPAPPCAESDLPACE